MSEQAVEWPDVDVVMPIRNEAAGLADAVGAVRAQDYAGRVRIFLGVGPSDDGTERIAAQLATDDGDLVVVENPSGLTPAALNVAIRSGSAPVIVRVDGHSQLSAGYIRRAVETLRRTGAANVGGMQVPVPTTPFETAVSAATTSWLGTGGASYRVGGTEGPVDTVFLGVFDREAIEHVGLFDERLIRNQDYELNIRLRNDGRTVWFDPQLQVGYRPRGSWRTLARQYYEYGYWKMAVVRMHPRSARLRQILPPVAVGAVATSALLAPRWRPLALIPIGYAAVVVAVTTRTRSGVRTAIVVPVIHLSWSLGIFRGLAQLLLGDHRTGRDRGRR